MKIVQVVAGAGSLYCGACMRDATLARTLSRLGHDVTVMPIYTPLRLEEDLAVPSMPLHIGGIGTYLRERFPRYESLPAFIRTRLDDPRVVKWASRFAIKTRASDLGALTVSTLRGIDGRQRAEFVRTARDIASASPDLVILPNSMLIGLAPALRKATRARICCQVQGEDGFLNELPEKDRCEALALIRSKTDSVDEFLAPSHGHSVAMAKILEVDLARFFVVPHAIEAHPTQLRIASSKFVVGCLSSIRRAKGQDTLLEAARLLGPDEVCVLLAGKVWEPAFQSELRRLGDGLDVEFLGELSPAAKGWFFTKCDVVCLPSRLEESRGVVALEALAHGTPVIASDRGIFRELDTPAVQRFEPENAEALADLLRSQTREGLVSLGDEARGHVRERFSYEKAVAAIERWNR